MLEALRKGTGTWIAKIFIALLVLSFAVWGIADIFGGYGSRSLARVGDTEISAEQYRFAYQNEMRVIGRQIGRNLTLEEARQLGLDNRVLGRLVSEAAIKAHGERLNLGISDAAIAETVMREPAFHDTSGAFNRRLFEEILRANNLSEQRYIAHERDASVRRQLTSTIGEAAGLPDTLLQAANRYQNERRTLRHFTVTAERLEPLPDPTEEQLRAYYDANTQTFTAPEYRQLELLIVTPDTVADAVAVTDKEVEDYFALNKDQFVTPERRRVLQVSFEDRAVAEEAHKEIMGGGDFMAVAQGRGFAESDVDLGLMRRADLADPAVAEAAFALEEGAVSAPVEGRFGTVLVTVTAIEPEVAKPIDEVRAEIRRTIGQERARHEIHDIYDRVEDQRAAGSSLAEIAKALDLTFRQVEAVARDGTTPDGKPLDGVPSTDRVVALAFESEVGIENDPVDATDNSVVWVDVAGVTPSRLRSFEDVRGEVETAWRTAEERSRLARKGQELIERIRGGEAFAAVAAELDVEVQESKPLRRQEAEGGVPNSAVAQAFALSEGGLGSAPTRDGGARVIFQVAKVESPPPPEGEEAEKLAQMLRAQVQEDMVTQYVTGLRNAFGVTVNSALLNQLTGRTGG